MDPPDLRLAGKSSDRNQPHQNQRHHTMDPAATSAIPASDSTTAAATISPAGYFRWVICALLLFGTTKNYMDRGVLGVLKTTLQHDLGWNEIDYGNLVFAFQAAYAVGMLVVGRLVDRLGTRLGYALAMVFWSLASMGHALGSSLVSFFIARSALGFGESGVFPASIKTVAEWFPKRERALATGIFNAGTNVGAIITPLVVPWITIKWGWRWAFIATGALGFVWLIFWLVLYRKPEEHPRVSKAELEYIRSDHQEAAAKVKWSRLIPHRQTWAFAVGKFMIDPVWWFYLFWLPDFLQRKHGLPLIKIGVPIMVVYIIADVGSVAGGWLSSWLIGRGKTVNMARKTAMLICALCVLPMAFAYRIESMWGVVLLIGLAAAAHQGFSANLFTLTSDMFPSQAVASVVGLGGTAGAIGGMLIAKIVGYALQWTGSYMIPFRIAGFAYLLALAAIHLLVPRLDPAKIS
jgi:MFS transporter, ACS family, hexuronate transporter